MAKLEIIVRPKDQGGLGMIETKIMNECLLVKWIWKYVRGSNGTWFRILQTNYTPDDNS
jgi:hypothetical protein